MFNLSAILAETTLPNWVTNSLPIIRYVFLGIMAFAAILIIISVLFQQSSNDEGNAITGGATESYYAQNKNGTTSGKLKTLTIVCASIIAVLAILYFVSNLIYAGV